MTVFFPLNCRKEMVSPVLAGSVKSGAGLPITGSMLVAIHPPEAIPGSMGSPVRDFAERFGLFVDGLHRQSALEVLLDDAPVQIVEERIDVLGARATVVDPVRVLVHVE